MTVVDAFIEDRPTADYEQQLFHIMNLRIAGLVVLLASQPASGQADPTSPACIQACYTSHPPPQLCEGVQDPSGDVLARCTCESFQQQPAIYGCIRQCSMQDQAAFLTGIDVDQAYQCREELFPNITAMPTEASSEPFATMPNETSTKPTATTPDTTSTTSTVNDAQETAMSSAGDSAGVQFRPDAAGASIAWLVIAAWLLVT